MALEHKQFEGQVKFLHILNPSLLSIHHFQMRHTHSQEIVTFQVIRMRNIATIKRQYIQEKLFMKL